jgi:hypothetical protein
MPQEASQPAPAASQPLEERTPPPAIVLLDRLSEAADALATHWPAAMADDTFRGDVTWCAVAVVEQVAALLRDQHSQAVGLADRVTQATSDARHSWRAGDMWPAGEGTEGDR